MRKGFIENYYEWNYHQNTEVGTNSDVIEVAAASIYFQTLAITFFPHNLMFYR